MHHFCYGCLHSLHKFLKLCDHNNITHNIMAIVYHNILLMMAKVFQLDEILTWDETLGKRMEWKIYRKILKFLLSCIFSSLFCARSLYWWKLKQMSGCGGYCSYYYYSNDDHRCWKESDATAIYISHIENNQMHIHIWVRINFNDCRALWNLLLHDARNCFENKSKRKLFFIRLRCGVNINSHIIVLVSSTRVYSWYEYELTESIEIIKNNFQSDIYVRISIRILSTSAFRLILM